MRPDERDAFFAEGFPLLLASARGFSSAAEKLEGQRREADVLIVVRGLISGLGRSARFDHVAGSLETTRECARRTVIPGNLCMQFLYRIALL